MKRALSIGGVALLLAASAPPWPDDWDGLGFLASANTFDMAHFAPHPPGYPVYVALLRLFHLVLRDPRVAAYAISIASGVATALLADAAATRAWGKANGAWIAFAACATPLAWRAMSAIGTESLALAFATLGVWGVVAARDGARRGGLAVGIAVGLGVGVRLSWAPLFLPMLLLAPKGARARAVSVAAIAAVAWAVPLVALVGPSEVVTLYRVHAAGHATRWGGTALSDPGAMRAAYFLRDLFVDGLGVDRDPLGIGVGAASLALGVVGLAAWRRAAWRGAGAVALLLLPYAAWIAIGQNLRQQPRHALPLVVALGVALARGAVATPSAKSLALALALLVVGRTAGDAVARRTVAPPGAQLVAYVRARPDPRDVAVFAGPAARFFEPTELHDRAATVESLGGARIALGRMNDLPHHVLVTDELEGFSSSKAPLEHVATFCRPPRIDRRAPCLGVYDWKLPFLTR
jgi:hypothetical protein